MEVHTLGTLLGAWREGLAAAQCPLYPTGDQCLLYRGVIWRKPLSLPLQHTYLEVVGSNPVTGENFFGPKFNCLHEGMISVFMLTFLYHLLPIQLACCYLDRTLLPLFLIPLEALTKLLTLT